MPVCYDLLPVALQHAVFNWGLLISTHFILIFCTTWLGKGHSLENLAQTLPEKKTEAEKES